MRLGCLFVCIIRNTYFRVRRYRLLYLSLIFFSSIAIGSPDSNTTIPTECIPFSKLANDKNNESALIDLIPALISALVGAIIGFIGSWFILKQTNKASDTRSVEKEKKGNTELRTMLKAEIDQNLLTLNNEINILTQQQPGELSAIDWMKASPYPKWATNIFDNSSILQSRFLDSTEIPNVQNFYSLLQLLTASRESLNASSNLEHHEKSTPYFKWNEICEEIKINGNPIN